jgi:hypothetical protein
VAGCSCSSASAFLALFRSDGLGDIILRAWSWRPGRRRVVYVMPGRRLTLAARGWPAGRWSRLVAVPRWADVHDADVDRGAGDREQRAGGVASPWDIAERASRA